MREVHCVFIIFWNQHFTRYGFPGTSRSYIQL